MIGWTYEANREKIKEAEKAIEEFKLEDTISDLESAKEAELNALNERIDNWEDYLKMLQQKYDEYEEMENDKLLMELWGVSSEQAVQQILMSDLDSFTNYASDHTADFLEDQIGAYRNYASVFNDFLNEYTANNQKLGKLRKESTDALSAEAYYRALETNGEELEEVLEHYIDYYVPNIEPIEEEEVSVPAYTPVVSTKEGEWRINGTSGALYWVEDKTVEKGSTADKQASYSAAIEKRLTETGADSVTLQLSDGSKKTYTASQLDEAKAEIATGNVTGWGSTGSDVKSNTQIGSNAGKGNYSIQYVEDTSGNTVASAVLNASNSKITTAYGNDVATRYSELSSTYGDKLTAIMGNDGVMHWTKNDTAVTYDSKGNATITTGTGTWTGTLISAANGILAGPVEYTGLAMLHGSKTSPEYVLNSDQAYNLLANLATKQVSFEPIAQSGNSTSYIVQGDVVLEGVNDPEQFWNEVTSAMSNRWNVTKHK